jgi:hypothetical protein
MLSVYMNLGIYELNIICFQDKMLIFLWTSQMSISRGRMYGGDWG